MRSHVITIVPFLAAGLAGACGGAAAPENEVTQELTGIIEQFTTGFATIEIGSSVHFGLVFAPDLVFTHASWVTGVAPASIRVRQFSFDGTQVTTTTGRFVNILDGGGAVVQLAASLSTAPRIAQAYPGEIVHCSALGSRANGSPAEVVGTFQLFIVPGSPRLWLFPMNGSVDSGDLGAPCVDPDPGSSHFGSIGFVDWDSGAGAGFLTPYANFGELIDQMRFLAKVRDSSAQEVYIRTYPLWGLCFMGSCWPSVNSCLDVPGGDLYSNAPINYFPCHGGQNQRWWIYTDPSLDAQNPRIVSDVNGLCIDVPWASVTSGQNLQTYPCHGGANQRFASSLWPSQPWNAPPVWRLSPLSAPGLCLSVENWNYDVVEPIEQRTCDGANGDYDQQWQFIPAP